MTSRQAGNGVQGIHARRLGPRKQPRPICGACGNRISPNARTANIGAGIVVHAGCVRPVTTYRVT